jgi:hypothetical protein
VHCAEVLLQQLEVCGQGRRPVSWVACDSGKLQRVRLSCDLGVHRCRPFWTGRVLRSEDAQKARVAPRRYQLALGRLFSSACPGQPAITYLQEHDNADLADSVHVRRHKVRWSATRDYSAIGSSLLCCRGQP